MTASNLPVAIIGGGPVGLAAAAHLLARGLEPLVLEAGPGIATAVRAWGHVRMFSPWRYNTDPAARALLEAEGWVAPEADTYPTGAELVARYLAPLAATAALRGCIRIGARVVGIARRDHGRLHEGQALLTGTAQAIAGVAAGFGIGVVAAVLGVAGGELLIPTLVLLFGTDLRLAGSLSLAISLPTMLVGFARYGQDRSFAVLGRNRRFTLVMAAGSVAGSYLGGQLLGVVSAATLLPLLAAILVLSAVKLWRH